MKHFIVGTLMIAFCAFSTSAGAEINCDSVLIPTYTSVDEFKAQQLAYLQLIDQRTYEEKKSGGSASLGLPLVDEVLSASASWQDFQVNRAERLEQERFSYRDEESRSFLKVGTSEEAVKAWQECKLQNQEGVALYVRDVSDQSFTLHYRWKRDGIATAEAAFEVVGGTDGEGKSRWTKNLVGSQDNVPVIIRRIGDETRVTMNVAGQGDSVLVVGRSPLPDWHLRCNVPEMLAKLDRAKAILGSDALPARLVDIKGHAVNACRQGAIESCERALQSGHVVEIDRSVSPALQEIDRILHEVSEQIRRTCAPAE